MKKFLVNIRAYGHHATFQVVCEDSAKSIEDAIVDKLGEKGVKWEKDGFTTLSGKWITYEEVNNEQLKRPIQTKKVLGVELGAGASQFG
jgi:hypothetical protein|tara:strand:- start:232 stop:498 length:267 start_codon:yes stop_codon:yes gene_type:complete